MSATARWCRSSSFSLRIAVAFLAFGLAACGGSSSDGGGGSVMEPENPSQPTPEPGPQPTPEPEPQPEPTAEPQCEDVEFESTFDAVQKVFTDNCVSCHGENGLGGLDLREGHAYDNLFEVTATGSDKWLVHPADTERSFLYDKIVSWVDDSIVFSGGRMPPTGALSEQAINLIRFWIYGGAPRDAMIQGTDEILADSCLAPPGVFDIEPLDAPAPGVGVQMTMPSQLVAMASETETCMFVYEDFCDDVPEESRIEGTNLFRYGIDEIRMPPFSHHLIVLAPLANFGSEEIGPETFSDWACRGGASDGESCDPKDADACGEGRCATPLMKRMGCNGYEPANGAFMLNYAGTQQPQSYRTLPENVYGVAPCRTVVGYNLHAFNLTQEDAPVTARVNFEFAIDPKWRLRYISTDEPAKYGPLSPFGIGRLMQEGAAAYSENTLCTEVTLPQGAYLAGGTSHTHALGARSTWRNPDGELIYDSRFYNDPVVLRYDDPIHFPDEDPATRTFEFCTLYRNGVDKDGNIDVERMSRSSTRPYTFGGPSATEGAGCEPYRCVNEGVDRRAIDCDDGIANLKGDDAACDSSPGAGDGFCDACSIRGGITTQDEMYQGSLQYFLKEE